MSSTDWTTVFHQATAAVVTSLGATWTTVGPTVQHSIQMLVDTAAYIEANKSSLTQDDCDLLTTNQTLAMKNVLLGYEAIGIVAAEQAVAAAWGVISAALDDTVSAAMHA
jgi:hypothetical protein